MILDSIVNYDLSMMELYFWPILQGVNNPNITEFTSFVPGLSSIAPVPATAAAPSPAAAANARTISIYPPGSGGGGGGGFPVRAVVGIAVGAAAVLGTAAVAAVFVLGRRRQRKRRSHEWAAAAIQCGVLIQPEEIQFRKAPDGENWELGIGSYGTVRLLNAL